MAISVDSAVAHVRNASMQPTNVQARVAQAVNDVVKLFTGSGFINRWEAQINGTACDVTDKVRPQVGVVFTGFTQCKKVDAHPAGGGSVCQALKIQATTQSGYNSASQQRVAPSTNVGDARISASPVDAGDAYRCAYTIEHLPTGVPLIVQVTPAAGWATPHGVPVVPRAQQLGWWGTVTVLAPARIRAACARYRTSISR
jgi:hypothetical protein